MSLALEALAELVARFADSATRQAILAGSVKIVETFVAEAQRMRGVSLQSLAGNTGVGIVALKAVFVTGLTICDLPLVIVSDVAVALGIRKVSLLPFAGDTGVRVIALQAVIAAGLAIGYRFVIPVPSITFTTWGRGISGTG